MTKDKQAKLFTEVLLKYDPKEPQDVADELRSLWLRYTPKSIEVIKAALREQQETIGIPVPILKSIGEEISRKAHNHVDDYLLLVQLLWHEYGREGRVVATIPMGAMELANPGKVVPLLREMCRTCLTWEDVDRLAMDALEPVVRNPKSGWANIIVAAFFFLFNLVGLPTYPPLFDKFLLAVSMGFNGVTIWYAWNWS